MSGQTTPGTGAQRYRPGPVAALGERLREGGACVLTGEPAGGRSTILARVARAFDAGPAVVVPALPERCRQPLAGLRALCRAAGVPAADAAGPVGDLIGALWRTAAPGTVLLCADDADLWDAASRTALGRLAARLSPGDGVSLVLTVAGHRPVDPEFAGLPLLRLAPLSTADAAALLDDAAPGALDPRVRDEITAAAEGDPGLLLGVVHRLTAAQLGGLAPLPCPLVDAEALPELTAPHLSGLPLAERDLLLMTAAALHASEEPAVEAQVVARAVRSLADAGTDAAEEWWDLAAETTLRLLTARPTPEGARLTALVLVTCPPSRAAGLHQRVRAALGQAPTAAAVDLLLPAPPPRARPAGLAKPWSRPRPGCGCGPGPRPCPRPCWPASARCWPRCAGSSRAGRPTHGPPPVPGRAITPPSRWRTCGSGPPRPARSQPPLPWPAPRTRARPATRWCCSA
ncbi:hypothetical protein [Streptomyces achromogenes]|uniref:hypothetical protein n=1 Tax=Streptomyces achromogenes TaxID=67255 RepID=UPI003674AA40